MRRGWDALFLIIIGAVVLQMMVDFIRPLIPEMTIALVVFLIFRWNQRNRNW